MVGDDNVFLFDLNVPPVDLSPSNANVHNNPNPVHVNEVTSDSTIQQGFVDPHVDINHTSASLNSVDNGVQTHASSDYESTNKGQTVYEHTDDMESNETVISPDCPDEYKPFVGQNFCTVDEAIKFYEHYARIAGSCTRRLNIIHCIPCYNS